MGSNLYRGGVEGQGGSCLAYLRILPAHGICSILRVARVWTNAIRYRFHVVGYVAVFAAQDGGFR
jgi:hypothetical protein